MKKKCVVEVEYDENVFQLERPCGRTDRRVKSPVCSTVHIRSGRKRASWSHVTTLLSDDGPPELYVVARVDAHSSKYQGFNLKKKKSFENGVEC